MFKTPNFQLLTHLLVDCYKSNSTQGEVVAIPIEEMGKDCPRTFDGFACWGQTPSDTIPILNCPEYIVGFDPRRISFKKCLNDGSWFKYYSNATNPLTYTTCVDRDDLNFFNIVNMTYMGGYSISTVALMMCIAMFTCFRSLHCIRNRVHAHLFTSFILNNISWIIWYWTVVNYASVIMENKVWCQALHVVTHYFMLTEYAWMFCEALYLYLSLVVVFVNEKLSMLVFKLIGWGSPIIFMTAYAIRRHFTPDGTERCWIEDSDAMFIITIPVVMSLIASAVILVVIVGILVKKGNSNVNESSLTMAFKATRATFLLIPLFGLHFFLIPYRPSGDTTMDRVYHIFSAVLVSFQGLCVAVLFCFTNKEVQAELKAFYRRIRNLPQNNARRAIGVTGQGSVVHTMECAL